MSFKLIIKLSFATIITILIINILFFYSSKTENEKLFLDVSNQLTNQTAQALKVWIDDQIRVVDSISKEKKIIDLCLDPENEEKIELAQNYLEEIHKRYPYYESLPIAIKLDEPIYRKLEKKNVKIYNGHFLIDTVENEVVGKGGLEYSFVKEIFDGKDFFISEVYPSIYRQNPIFVISKPIKHNDEIIGVAIISPQVKYFTEFFIDNTKLGNSGYMFFLDDRGYVISHPNREYILSETEFVRGITTNILGNISNRDQYFKENLVGVDKLYSFKKANLIENYNMEYDWYIFFTQDMNEIYKPTYKSMWMIGIVILLLVSSLVVIIIIVSYLHYNKEKEEELLKLNMSLETLVEERTKELKTMVNTDGLTNLYNKKYLNKQLKKSIEEVKSNYKELSVAICDIDDFKKVNDRFGHLVGDDVIRAVSDALKRIVPNEDIVGRYGGEEFLIIFNNTNFKDAMNVCEQIRLEIENLDLEISELNVTISIGIYLWDKQNSAELVKAADDLLYKAKASGKNQVCYEL